MSQAVVDRVATIKLDQTLSANSNDVTTVFGARSYGFAAAETQLAMAA